MAIPLTSAGQTKAGPQRPAATADQASVTSGDNAFAVDLYGQLRSNQGNLFFSPASISTAFAMAYVGARGTTASEMQKVFHFTLPPDRLHATMGALLAGMNGLHQGYELRVANALWAEQGARFLPGFLHQMQTNYGAGFHEVDFKTAPESARATINDWVEEKTNKRIQNLIGPGALTPQTRLVLTNAIYFKGTWQDPFRATETEDGDFHLSSSRNAKARLMHRTGGYRYYDGGTFQELEIPYKGNGLAMVVLLPKETDGLAALEQGLTGKAVSEWIERLAPAQRVILTLPRFTMTQEFELSGTLKKMGMPQAFSGAADFSGMTGRPEFAISAAIHKAFVDVTEEGTEAAAATGITMYASARRAEPEPPVVFRADHPFVFLIRDVNTGAILFLGRVMNPAG